LLATSKNFPTHKIYTHVFTKNYFTDDKIRQAQGDQIGGIRLLGGTLLWVVFQILKKERIFFGIPFLNEPVMYHFVHFLTKNGLGDFLETFWQLFGDFLATFWRLFGDFLATFWRLFGDFLATFSQTLLVTLFMLSPPFYISFLRSRENNYFCQNALKFRSLIPFLTLF
jgi:hypothetical protein